MDHILKYGKLTVLESMKRSERDNDKVKCMCDCGNITFVTPGNLRSGGTRSCGCSKREITTTHGGAHTRLYNIWSKMKYRCNNRNYYAYGYYGGKGISVCETWAKSFKEFQKWSLSNGYNDDLTIDCIDSNSDYDPSNCRWVTHSYNSVRANALFVTVDGVTDCLKGWSKRLNVSPHLITDKYKELGESYIKKIIREFYETGSNSHLYKRKFYADNCQSSSNK